ncbi:MAG: hypothetical protein NUV97_00695 [archaeon]|nr:hypothetical protein [archaeon]MCR4323347.1 hypothetical protein [Nanoarchaeota archaeon]
MNNRGQVTIFIIVAVVLVAGILGVVFLGGEKEVKTPQEVSPGQFIKSCVTEAIEEKVDIILGYGGKLDPQKTILYEGDKYNYLCYQADYYLPCYNLQPMIESSVEAEIKASTEEQVRNCFNMLKEDYEDRGFTVEGNETEYFIDLLPGSINIQLRKNVEISKEGTSQRFENFDIKILSSLYNLIGVTRDIVNAESEYCYFEYGGYMMLYPELDIKQVNYKGSRLYSVENRKTKEKFKFAVRSCSPKPGI